MSRLTNLCGWTLLALSIGACATESGDDDDCTAANCAGCCLDGTCQPGDTASACGKSAIECAQCGNDQICRVDQTCGVDPDSNWKVQPVAGTIAADNDGVEWDVDNSAPDVVVNLNCPPLGGTWDSQTPEVQSYDPTWTTGGCIATASDLLSAGLEIQMFDVDVVVDDPIADMFTYVVTEDDLTNGSVTLIPDGNVGWLTLDLQLQ
ncbi:MAG: hypothetical protein A2341_28120 [Deltaproteobacteria bacterium RIFOXYB12_FULL_58_9]|nr:MAG: hypothetical protein A2341_28120 [Deltaproteobacteria bacterium RIFOXYB12_FULL_58_9]